MNILSIDAATKTGWTTIFLSGDPVLPSLLFNVVNHLGCVFYGVGIHKQQDWSANGAQALPGLYPSTQSKMTDNERRTAK